MHLAGEHLHEPQLPALSLGNCKSLHTRSDVLHTYRPCCMIHPCSLTYTAIYARAGWKQSTAGPTLAAPRQKQGEMQAVIPTSVVPARGRIVPKLEGKMLVSYKEKQRSSISHKYVCEEDLLRSHHPHWKLHQHQQGWSFTTKPACVRLYRTVAKTPLIATFMLP